MTYAFLEVERRERFAIVSFNRPERLNALVPEMLGAFDDLMADLDQDPEILAVVLTGKGRAFCAGLDVAVLQEVGPTPFLPFDPARTIANWRGPVIAAINGAAATGGFEITVACDVILAADNAVFVDTHSRVGLLPGWGLSARLHRAIGIYRAKELEMTGRPLPAAEAYEWGLVNRVAPSAELLESACEMARLIATGAPGLPAETKALIDGGSMLPLEAALEFERRFSSRRHEVSGSSLSFDHVGISRS